MNYKSCIMNYKSCFIMMAALAILWGCSSDDDSDSTKSKPQTEQQEENSLNSLFTASEYPDWAINWKWFEAAPTWQEPDRNQYADPCSMQLRVVLDEGLASFSTDADKMAVFIDQTCRAISKRNVIEQDGKVVFLLSIWGDRQEIGSAMELRYFSAQLTQTFKNRKLPPFEPDNLWGDKYNLVQEISMGSSKYPYTTKLSVLLPSALPFKAHSGDCVFVFVKDECRGVFKTSTENVFSGYVFSHNEGETAEIRYYSVDKQGYYTIKSPVTLNNADQSVNIKF